MKRKWIIATAGVAAAAALVYVGTLWAEQPAVASAVPSRPAAAPRTKIALLNLTYVISYYEKYKAYKDDMKKQAQPYEDMIKGKQAEIEALRKEATNTAASARRGPPPGDREADEGGPARHRRRQQRRQAEARQAGVGSRWSCCTRKCSRPQPSYAASHDFDMVLQYNEPLEPKDYYSPANIERKMGAGALIPLYYSQRHGDQPGRAGHAQRQYRPAARSRRTGVGRRRPGSRHASGHWAIQPLRPCGGGRNSLPS